MCFEISGASNEGWEGENVESARARGRAVAGSRAGPAVRGKREAERKE